MGPWWHQVLIHQVESLLQTQCKFSVLTLNLGKLLWSSFCLKLLRGVFWNFPITHDTSQSWRFNLEYLVMWNSQQWRHICLSEAGDRWSNHPRWCHSLPGGGRKTVRVSSWRRCCLTLCKYIRISWARVLLCNFWTNLGEASKHTLIIPCKRPSLTGKCEGFYLKMDQIVHRSRK